MRIGYVHYVPPMASSRVHVDGFVKAARDLGHEVCVIPMLAGWGAEDDGPTAANAMSDLLRRRLRYPFHEPRELLRNLAWLRRQCRDSRLQAIDVMLVRPSVLECCAGMVARRWQLPLVYEINAPPEEANYFPQYKHYPPLHRCVVACRKRWAGMFVTVTNALREHLVEKYRLDPDRVVVAPNGVDTALFHPGVHPDPRFLPADSSVTVGFVGSFKRFHGIDLLGRLVERVLRRRSDVRFLLVGEGPELSLLRAALGGEPRVAFVGYVPHSRIPSIVAVLDVGIVPDSNFYGCSLKALEWMAMGKAVLGPRYAAFEEIIEDGVTGLLFEPQKLDAMEEKLCLLIDRADVRRDLGRAAAQRVRQEFTWRHNAEAVIAACRRAQEWCG